MKKGFTLIEIIISIGLILVISTISIFSFNMISKNNKLKTLETMSEEIYNAVNVYIETNNDVKNKLYKSSKTGLKIPLTTLENAGLVDFEGINLTEEDFVVTMLGTTDAGDDHCANTYTAKSWDIRKGETIYICEKSDGSQNLVAVGGVADNLSKVTREVFYFKGGNPSNYAQVKGDTSKTYRILSIDRDDTITIVSNGSFDNKFEGFTMPQAYNGARTENVVYCNSNTNEFDKDYKSFDVTTVDGETNVSAYDVIHIATCFIDDVSNFSANAWIGIANKSGTNTYFQVSSPDNNLKKIHLNNCMKITGGTGDPANPYILENKCSTS